TPRLVIAGVIGSLAAMVLAPAGMTLVGTRTAMISGLAVFFVVQAGAVPVTWQQVLLEYQRDWSRKATYDAVMDLVREHSGAY
ncbi:hypothetical protein K4H03_28855, partial [Mycobacterium tuberculosis]|nr:hypothetical protein [Mycobacterium tuberculosis]